MRSFQVEIEGVNYRGTWILDGRDVKVMSDYGTSRAYLDGAEPSTLAREVLIDIVQSFRARAGRR